MIRPFIWFVKITGYPVQKLVFRTKVICEGGDPRLRKIRGKAIIVSNHTSVYDYAAMLFVFFGRTIRCQMAEVLFGKKPLGAFLRAMGGIEVDRESKDFGFMAKSSAILAKGGVVEIFPESRLPKDGEERPLPFKPSAAYLAMETGAPVIPVYTDGNYFGKGRAHVVIGKPIDVLSMVDRTLSDRENIDRVTRFLREETVRLGGLLDERTE